MPVEPLSQQDIATRLTELPGWSHEGDRLARTYRLGSHFAAAALVMHIAQVQDELDHHSDLALGYNTVGIAVNTHSAGGAVTAKDFHLAARIQLLASAHGAE
ncbi:putative pterin-4-alpha-carbinolamine dehydratase [Streptomyces sp. YIM 130001]|uniref:4a-hydroxytetrahydrobiopterin dehydratase n=1 Tax=Streptomyces sp. YIM 130001 TaxID=2259644 RepID=UPI000E655E21|nr:4a-hydroxytetrahydrobiopterin dehydratase [Streptomyces sp. YIM 130001]RII12372.1 putative pterin-4-alpha-carbinolamine dehydratase [Streptomyces sp. YIM 130001]